VDLANVKRIALDYIARMYVANNADTSLLDERFQLWYEKQLFKYDPCNMADISVSLTAAMQFEIPGHMTPQYGHVFIVTFEETEKGVTKLQTAEIFLRVSESGRIVEMCQFRPTVH
jgi:hypothetical protein